MDPLIPSATPILLKTSGSSVSIRDLTPSPKMSLFDPHTGSPGPTLTNAFPMPECLQRCNSSTSHILTTFAGLKKDDLSCGTKDLTPWKEWSDWCFEKSSCAGETAESVKVWLADVENLLDMPKEKCEECAKSPVAYPSGCYKAEATVTEVAWVTESACSTKKLKAGASKPKGSAAMVALVLAVAGLVLSGV